ncbi:GNAT family N-acetyltransferase, partial [Candidatus Bipolaricaulota bacterium]|nr:GNAT family N-acetyltransferase [Candidatus Bipolaricaulota bacterium]
RVHPDFRDRGIGSALLTWIEERAREVIPKAPSEARVTLGQGIWTQDEKAVPLLRAHGFEIVRHFWRMVTKLDAPIPAPVWPDGIALRTYDPDCNLEAVVRTFRDSFADHWGYVPQPFDADLAQWRNSIDENPDHDPSLWFLAWDGNRVAGIALSEPSIPEDPRMGFVDVLAVPRPWRRRGLATALLRHTFRTFAERGRERVGLGVDSTNLTGAIGLYEKVGMHVARQIDVFQKELRSGVDLSRQALRDPFGQAAGRAMKPFHELTFLGQARRLRPLAMEALRRFGVDPRSMKQLTAATNTVFRVDRETGAPLVLRMTSPKSCHTPEVIRSEVAWLHALSEETDIGLPEPVPTANGHFVVTVRGEGIPGDRHCALFRWVPGAMLDDRLTPRNVERHGRLSAKLHEHGSRFRPPPGFRIRTYDSVFPYSDPAFAGFEPIVLFDLGKDLMPPERKDAFRHAHDRIRTIIDRLFAEAEEQVIHNDLHVWNVKVTRSRIYALDFEDLLWGHPIQDLGTTLFYYSANERREELLAAFRRGYESARAWPEHRPGDLDAMIAGRAILLANFVAASEDASDRALAPEYLARTEARLRRFLGETQR